MHCDDFNLLQVSHLLYEKSRQYDKIFLGGQDIGGTVALHFLRHSLYKHFAHKIVGIFTFNSYLVRHSLVFQEVQPNLPILMIESTF